MKFALFPLFSLAEPCESTWDFYFSTEVGCSSTFPNGVLTIALLERNTISHKTQGLEKVSDKTHGLERAANQVAEMAPTPVLPPLDDS